MFCHKIFPLNVQLTVVISNTEVSKYLLYQSLDRFLIFFTLNSSYLKLLMSQSKFFSSNYWYLKVNFLEPENLLLDTSSLQLLLPQTTDTSNFFFTSNYWYLEENFLVSENFLETPAVCDDYRLWDISS